MEKIAALIFAIAMESFAEKYEILGYFKKACRHNWLSSFLTKIDDKLDNCSICKCEKIKSVLSFIKINHLLKYVFTIPVLLFVYLIYCLFYYFMGSIGCQIITILILFYIFSNNFVNTDSPIVEANDKIFTVMFWHILLGPFAVVLYWYFYSLNSSGIISKIFLWVPSRITGIIFALIGNFNSGFKKWLSCIYDWKMPSDKVVLTCFSAVNEKSNKDQKTIQDTILKRTLIFWFILVFLAVAKINI